MVLALLLVFEVLRRGLRLRRQRQGLPGTGDVARSQLLAAHLRLAKPAVILVLVGFVGGMASAVWLRGFGPLSKFHGWLGLLAAGLFATAAFWGRRLERARPAEAKALAGRHGLAGLLAVLVASLAAIAGFVLLP